MLELATIENGLDEDAELPVEQGALVVETVTDEAGFRRLEADWNNVLAGSASANIFLTWEWMSAWWTHFGDSNQLHVLVVRESRDGTIVGLLPLMRKRQPFGAGWIRELSFLTTPLTAPDHLDLIAKKEYQSRVVDAVVKTLREQKGTWDVLSLNGIPAESALRKALVDDCPEGRAYQWERVCPCLTFPATWEEYFKTIPKKYRHNIRNRERKLERDANEPIVYRRVTEERELNQALADLFSLHEQTRKLQGETGAFGKQSMRAFHREIAGQFLRNDWLRFYQLQVGNRTIATAYCFRYGETVSYYQTGYDEKWSNYGPGVSLLVHLLRSSMEEGIKTFDFLRGNHPYKYRWTNQTQTDLKFGLAASFKGKAMLSTYSVLRDVRNRWKSWRQR